MTLSLNSRSIPRAFIRSLLIIISQVRRSDSLSSTYTIHSICQRCAWNGWVVQVVLDVLCCGTFLKNASFTRVTPPPESNSVFIFCKWLLFVGLFIVCIHPTVIADTCLCFFLSYFEKVMQLTYNIHNWFLQVPRCTIYFLMSLMFHRVIWTFGLADDSGLSLPSNLHSLPGGKHFLCGSRLRQTFVDWHSTTLVTSFSICLMTCTLTTELESLSMLPICINNNELKESLNYISYFCFHLDTGKHVGGCVPLEMVTYSVTLVERQRHCYNQILDVESMVGQFITDKDDSQM